jgi:hypothetical protein
LLTAIMHANFGKFYGRLAGNLKCYRRVSAVRLGSVTRSSPALAETAPTKRIGEGTAPGAWA